jgi:hypothetical protein
MENTLLFLQAFSWRPWHLGSSLVTLANLLPQAMYQTSPPRSLLADLQEDEVAHQLSPATTASGTPQAFHSFLSSTGPSQIPLPPRLKQKHPHQLQLA